MSTANALRKAALQLPREERADLARELIESLDDQAEANESGDVEAAWLEEVERRLSTIGHGAVLEPWEDVQRRIFEHLQHSRK